MVFFCSYKHKWNLLFQNTLCALIFLFPFLKYENTLSFLIYDFPRNNDAFSVFDLLFLFFRIDILTPNDLVEPLYIYKLDWKNNFLLHYGAHMMKWTILKVSIKFRGHVRTPALGKHPFGSLKSVIWSGRVILTSICSGRGVFTAICSGSTFWSGVAVHTKSCNGLLPFAQAKLKPPMAKPSHFVFQYFLFLFLSAKTPFLSTF